MVRRGVGAAGALLVVLGVVFVWGVARSPDSEWTSGLIVASPFLTLGAGMVYLAWAMGGRAQP
jgi:hypothetical protein